MAKIAVTFEARKTACTMLTGRRSGRSRRACPSAEHVDILLIWSIQARLMVRMATRVAMDVHRLS